VTASEILLCAECGRQALAEEQPEDTRRVYLDVDDVAHTFCPECAEREFGEGLLRQVGRLASSR
jgi:hypothetical protein